MEQYSFIGILLFPPADYYDFEYLLRASTLAHLNVKQHSKFNVVWIIV